MLGGAYRPITLLSFDIYALAAVIATPFTQLSFLLVNHCTAIMSVVVRWYILSLLLFRYARASSMGRISVRSFAPQLRRRWQPVAVMLLEWPTRLFQSSESGWQPLSLICLYGPSGCVMRLSKHKKRTTIMCQSNRWMFVGTRVACLCCIPQRTGNAASPNLTEGHSEPGDGCAASIATGKRHGHRHHTEAAGAPLLLLLPMLLVSLQCVTTNNIKHFPYYTLMGRGRIGEYSV